MFKEAEEGGGGWICILRDLKACFVAGAGGAATAAPEFSISKIMVLTNGECGGNEDFLSIWGKLDGFTCMTKENKIK